MKTLTVLLLLAFTFWFFIFSPWTEFIPFWPAMAGSTFILGLCAVLAQRKHKDLFRFKPSHLAVGVLSAVLLYAVFLAGAYLVRFFPFAGRAVANIYTIRTEAPLPVIAVLIFFIIGPAEELFWRGFVQQRLRERLGHPSGLLLTSFFYAVGHIWSFNLMLILTAAICGLFWGILFTKYKSLWPVIISHAVWDLVIFVLLPITSLVEIL